jgi:hypothetical protein
VKFYFFSPLNNHIALGYEWMMRPGFNWDIAAGIIGPGTNFYKAFQYEETVTHKGGFIRFGPKFLLGSSSDVEVEGAKYAHPLKGRYFKLEMILNTMAATHFRDTGYYVSGQLRYTNKYQSMTLILGYGRQLIIGNTITIAGYAGLGYGFENRTSNKPAGYSTWYDNWEAQRFSHTFMGENFPLATSIRITVGYIFKTPGFLEGKNNIPKSPTRRSMGT